MVLRANLSIPQGRLRLIGQLVSACEYGERVKATIARDDDGLVAAVFSAKPDSRVYYVERVETEDGTKRMTVLILRPNRTKRITPNPIKRKRGELYRDSRQSASGLDPGAVHETRANPQVFVHVLPSEPLSQHTDIAPIRRWLLNKLRLGSSQTLLERQQIRSDRQLKRLYQRLFN